MRHLKSCIAFLCSYTVFLRVLLNLTHTYTYIYLYINFINAIIQIHTYYRAHISYKKNNTKHITENRLFLGGFIIIFQFRQTAYHKRNTPFNSKFIHSSISVQLPVVYYVYVVYTSSQTYSHLLFKYVSFLVRYTYYVVLSKFSTHVASGFLTNLR